MELAARMLVLARRRSRSGRRATSAVRQALASGAGLEKFREHHRNQGGDPAVVDDYARLPAAPDRDLVRAPRAGIVVRDARGSWSAGRRWCSAPAATALDDGRRSGRRVSRSLAPLGTTVTAGDAISRDAPSRRPRPRRRPAGCSTGRSRIGDAPAAGRRSCWTRIGRIDNRRSHEDTLMADAPPDLRAPSDRPLRLAAGGLALALGGGRLPDREQHQPARCRRSLGVVCFIAVVAAFSQQPARGELAHGRLGHGAAGRPGAVHPQVRASAAGGPATRSSARRRRRQEVPRVHQRRARSSCSDRSPTSRRWTRCSAPGNGFVFAFTALPTIIFVSSFFTVLYYFGILQFDREGVRQGDDVADADERRRDAVGGRQRVHGADRGADHRQAVRARR